MLSVILHKFSIRWFINTDTDAFKNVHNLIIVPITMCHIVVLLFCFVFSQGADWLLELSSPSVCFQCCKYCRKWQHGHKELIIYAELHQWATISHKKKNPDCNGITVHRRTGCHHASWLVSHALNKADVTVCTKGNQDASARCFLPSWELHTAPSYTHCSTNTGLYEHVKEMYNC